MEPTAPARAPDLPLLLHYGALEPDQRGREDALGEPEPSAPPGWETSLGGARLGAPCCTQSCSSLPEVPVLEQGSGTAQGLQLLQGDGIHQLTDGLHDSVQLPGHGHSLTWHRE